MRGVKSNQNVVNALFLDIIFLSCSFQGLSHLSKRFCPRILESVSVGPITIKREFNPPKVIFCKSLQPNFLRIPAQNIKKLPHCISTPIVYFNNSSTAGPQPGMKKEEGRNTQIILENLNVDFFYRLENIFRQFLHNLINSCFQIPNT